MIRLPRSIRWRLQLYYGLLLVAVLCGLGATAFHFERSRQLGRTDAELQTRVAALVDALRAVPGGGPEKRDVPSPKFSAEQAALFGGRDGYYFVIWMRGEKPLLVSPNAPAEVPRPAKGASIPRMRGEFRESFLFAAPVDCLLVGRSVAGEQAEIRRFALVLLGAGAVVLGAGLLGGWWFTMRAIRPVEDIIATAEQISATDLSRRIRMDDTTSELGRLASVLNSTFSRLDAAFSQQAQFTADAAHELRTPVSVILTQTQSTLARERSADDYRETLEACQRAAQRMRRLVDSLLELARLDAGQEPLRRAECDLATITADGIAHIRPLAEARGLAISTALSSAPIHADQERIAQVVTNLLGNAIEYNHDGGNIRVATGLDGNFAVITVSNTGPGISEAELPHIFDRFRRADGSRTSGHAGLGLAICKAIIAAHDGSIDVQSAADGETTFRVRFPA